MADSSFDIASKIDHQELDNAINQTLKEIENRYDLKDANSEITFKSTEHKLAFSAADEFKLKSVYEIFKQKLVKRGISIKAMNPGKIESALGGTAKQEIQVQNGIPKEKAKEIVKEIKSTGIKVQAQIQEDQIRVSGKKLDDLQAVIRFLKEKDFEIDMQFTNYR
jgi:uncharacterized protein YajQ (UPF0234 family)